MSPEPTARTTNPANDATRHAIAAAVADFDFEDRRDVADASRGFLATAATRQITDEAGRVVWDLDAYGFLDADAPGTVNPSLWRQSQLCARDGLYEVVPGILQVRGFDLSNVTFVEGDEGVLVIDPLVSRETAAAALALYRAHRGERRVTGVIYTHSHVDHFGGVKGVVDPGEVARGAVPIIAPVGFMEHAVAENVYAGTAMARRAGYMYGAALAKGPAGQVGSGLGQTTSRGEITLIPPTVEVTETGQVLVVDGIELEFQLTPGTEAPAEMNFFFPQHRALCTAENTSHTMHNLLTLRGALVRDPRVWARYLDEAIERFGDRLELVFASHHWPTWGREEAVEFLSVQRDLYAYLHDQTLRLLNQGLVGSEIAEQLELPPALVAAWHAHGYYGSVSHNVKAVYQRYMGWFDGNPAHLWAHPPVEAAQRYVAAMGGEDAAIETARRALDEGDHRWAAEVLNHVVFADAASARAKSLQADTLEQLGYGSENGTWRNFYLSGASELRDGSFGTPTSISHDLLDALSVDQLLDGIAVRVDGPSAWSLDLTVSIVVTDAGETHVARLRNGVLTHRPAASPAGVGTTLSATRTALLGLVTGRLDASGALADGTLRLEGDAADLTALLGVLARVDPDFAIVTP